LPGSSPDEAFQHFARPIQAALHCVTPAKLGRPRLVLDELQVLTFQHGTPVELRRRDAGSRIFLDTTLHYRLVEVHDPDDVRGPFHASTGGYMFTIRDKRKQEIISFHWDPRDPNSRRYPHLHIGATVLDAENPVFGDSFSRLHIPTGRVTVEDVVRFLIEELKVIPLQSDWHDTLMASKEIHVMYRSWP
jgi:hypothetical protein